MSDQQGPYGQQWDQQPTQGPWSQQSNQGQYAAPGSPGQYGGPGGPGQYGGPGGNGGNGGGSGLNPKIIIAIVVALLLVVAGVVITLVLTLGGDSDEKSPKDKKGTDDKDSAQSVADDYVDALRASDCKAAQAIMIDKDEDCSVTVPPKDSYEFENPKEQSADDTSATYAVTVTEVEGPGEGLDSNTLKLTLAKIDSTWMVKNFGGTVDDSGSDSSSSSGAAPDPNPGSPSPADPSDPLPTANAFLAAVKAKDCDKAKTYMYLPEVAECSDIILENVALGTQRVGERTR